MVLKNIRDHFVETNKFYKSAKQRLISASLLRIGSNSVLYDYHKHSLTYSMIKPSLYSELPPISGSRYNMLPLLSPKYYKVIKFSNLKMSLSSRKAITYKLLKSSNTKLTLLRHNHLKLNNSILYTGSSMITLPSSIFNYSELTSYISTKSHKLGRQPASIGKRY